MARTVFGDFEVVDDVPGAFAAAVISAWQARRRHFFSLVLSGGELARSCYERLAADAHDVIEWSMVDLYWGDERLVPRRHPDSNERLVREALVNRVPPIRGVFPMRVEDTADAYGPRFLHSTGQLHKGGPNTAVVVQVVPRAARAALPIPGFGYDFATLIDAQAIGDYESLVQHGRRVVRVAVDDFAEIN